MDSRVISAGTFGTSPSPMRWPELPPGAAAPHSPGSSASHTPTPPLLPAYSEVQKQDKTAVQQAERNRQKQAIRDGVRISPRPHGFPISARLPMTPPSPRPGSIEPPGSEDGTHPLTPNRADRMEDETGQTSSAVIMNLNGQVIRPESVASVTSLLPEGMNVREALAACEDPALGWSLQFWITIADPVNEHVFFACPATGQTSWKPPQGVFVVPRQPDGEWWELADTSRNNRSYFYNTLSKKVQWTRPGGDQFVIPLGLIQNAASPPVQRRRANSSSHLRANDPSSPLARTRASSVGPTASKPAAHTPKPPPTPRPSPSRATTESALRTPIPQSRCSDLSALLFPQSPASDSHALATPPIHSPNSDVAPATPLTPQRYPRPLSVVGESEEGGALGSVYAESANDADQSVVSATSRNSDDTVRKANAAPAEGSGIKERTSPGRGFLAMLSKRKEKARLTRFDLGSKNNLHVNASNISLPLSPNLPINKSNLRISYAAKPPGHGPIPVTPQPDRVRSKRLSTGLHPILPSDISADIHSFRLTDFAAQYFATRRSGVWRQKIPPERMLHWQKSPISASLLASCDHHSREAVIMFKVVQRTMGQRGKAVEGAIPVANAASTISLPYIPIEQASKVAAPPEKMVVLEEIRWMLQICARTPALRDEVYCQVIKQLTGNPDSEAVVLGFQLLCVLVVAFGPGKEVEPFVRTFLESNNNRTSGGIATMSRYCLSKLDVVAVRGGRARALTVGEIEQASDAAFYPSIFGESLAGIMKLQSRSHPALSVPVILPFLAHAILFLRGHQAEGIFRIPGDVECVAEMRSRMDRGHYQLAGIDDPHVAASLFKLWLRELKEPVVPTAQYNDALAASLSVSASVAFVKQLPQANRRVLVFVVALLQIFCRPENVAHTKMTDQNLALIFAPNILRTTSESLTTVYTNAGYECRFILNLLQGMRTGEVDEEYDPRVDLPRVGR